MTDQLTSSVSPGDDEPVLELAPDADPFAPDGGSADVGEPAEGATADAEPAQAPQADDWMARFKKDKDIDALPEGPREFFRDYKRAFNREMEKARRMVKEAAEAKERYEAAVAPRAPVAGPAAPPDLGAEVDPTFKAAFDARVEHLVNQRLESLGIPKRLESAEEKANRIATESWVSNVMSELTSKHGMTTDEQAAIEQMVADDPGMIHLFQSPQGRARVVKMARLELNEAKQHVSQVQRQADSARAGVSRPATGNATPTPTDWAKYKAEHGEEKTREAIVAETMRDLNLAWP